MRQYITTVLLLCFSVNLWADTVKVIGRTIIDRPTVYSDTDLDLTSGYFEIVNNASLSIENATVVAEISPTNSQLIRLKDGMLSLKNNIFTVSSAKIEQTPNTPSLYYMIDVESGTVDINDNQFTIKTPYIAGLLATGNAETYGFNLSDNTVNNFHGGFVLRNTHEPIITHNRFSRVSISNVLLLDSDSGLIENNTMLFPGNDTAGDGIDIINSTHIKVNKNIVLSGSCYSMAIYCGQNITLDSNRVGGGITYAVRLAQLNNMENYLSTFGSSDVKASACSNQNITLNNNYFAQNRYGITASDVDGLSIKRNTFVQKFSSLKSRQFWTNNDILMRNNEKFVWNSNLYKEAYPQNDTDDITLSSKRVEFPKSGGVDLNN